MADFELDQMLNGKPVKFEKGDKTMCVTRIGDEVFAIDDICTHSEASLSEGDVSDHKIECWLHGAEFDLRTGEALTLPANIAVQTYPVTIVANSVTVEI